MFYAYEEIDFIHEQFITNEISVDKKTVDKVLEYYYNFLCQEYPNPANNIILISLVTQINQMVVSKIFEYQLRFLCHKGIVITKK
jgi:hypothetical protein